MSRAAGSGSCSYSWAGGLLSETPAQPPSGSPSARCPGLVTGEAQAGRTGRGAGRLSRPRRPVSREGLSPLHPEGTHGGRGARLASGPRARAERPCGGGADPEKTLLALTSAGPLLCGTTHTRELTPEDPPRAHCAAGLSPWPRAPQARGDWSPCAVLRPQHLPRLWGAPSGRRMLSPPASPEGRQPGRAQEPTEAEGSVLAVHSVFKDLAAQA